MGLFGKRIEGTNIIDPGSPFDPSPPMRSFVPWWSHWQWYGPPKFPLFPADHQRVSTDFPLDVESARAFLLDSFKSQKCLGGFDPDEPIIISEHAGELLFYFGIWRRSLFWRRNHRSVVCFIAKLNEREGGCSLEGEFFVPYDKVIANTSPGFNKALALTMFVGICSLLAGLWTVVFAVIVILIPFMLVLAPKLVYVTRLSIDSTESEEILQYVKRLSKMAAKAGASGLPPAAVEERRPVSGRA